MRVNALIQFAIVVVAGLACDSQALAQAERVWLTHRSHDPSKIVVSWTTKLPSESVVRFGTTKDLGHEQKIAGSRTLHHVEIPITEQDQTYHYSVGPADLAPKTGTFKSCPSDKLRVAIVANWHAKVD